MTDRKGSRESAWVLAMVMAGCATSPGRAQHPWAVEVGMYRVLPEVMVATGQREWELEGAPEERGRPAEEETAAAREAEVERAWEAVKAVASGTGQVNTQQVWRWWVEGGALTPVSFRSQGGQQRAGVVRPAVRLGDPLRVALGQYARAHTGHIEVVLEREADGWRMEYRALEAPARPPEARRLPVMSTSLSADTYLALHALGERAVKLLPVPAGGEARLVWELELEDGRLREAPPPRYEVTQRGGAVQRVDPVVVGEVTWVLAALSEGLGRRTVRLELRGEHRPGEELAEARVAEAWVVRPESPPEGYSEDALVQYRVRHEFVQKRFREKVAEDFGWVFEQGGEQIFWWYAGGIAMRGTGLLAELALPAVRAALSRSGAVAAGWLKTALGRMLPEERLAFGRLWAKVQLEGEKALARQEREALRKLMQRLEQTVRTPLSTKEKVYFREKAREAYIKLHPQFEKLMREGKWRYPVHHKYPMEHAHRFPDEDFNAIEKLAMMELKVHERINARWVQFNRLRPNPTREELERMARLVDKHFEGWYARNTLSQRPLSGLRDADDVAQKELDSIFGAVR